MELTITRSGWDEPPALLIRGENSRVTTQNHVEEMAERRPDTRLRVLSGGHVVHFDNPKGFNVAVLEFLAQLPARGRMFRSLAPYAYGE